MIVKKGNSEHLLVIGGKNDNRSWLKSTERLNLTSITKNNASITWENAADLSKPRANFAAIAIDHLAYVFGGISGKTGTHVPEMVASIECYNPSNNSWQEYYIEGAPSLAAFAWTFKTPTEILVFGGSDGNLLSNNLWSLDFAG